MTKTFTTIGTAFAFSFLPIALLAATPFEVEENFDDDSHFTESSKVPDGWKIENVSGYDFRREEGSYFGAPTKSGTYMFAAAGSYNKLGGTLYTALYNLEAGEKCEIEFWFYAPGSTPQSSRNSGILLTAGTAQDANAQTIELGTVANKAYSSWTKFKFDFTPETKGEYCIAFNFQGGTLDGTGTTALDDIIISGMSPASEPEKPSFDPADFEPNVENLSSCVELPYNENFDGENYDGTSYLPIGWTSVGSAVWRTANVASLQAVANDWYMITPENSSDRDERAYTPFFDLEAGVEYTISFYSHLEGGDAVLGGYKASLDFTVGTEQDMDFQQLVLLSLPEHSNVGWERQQVTFTPVHSGPYCFAFVLSGPAYSGFAAIDALRITAPGLADRVVPNFVIHGLYDLMDSNLIAFYGEPIDALNTSRYATSYVWEVEGGATVTNNGDDAKVLFPESGSYVILLRAANERGERTARKRVNVTVVNGNAEGIVPMNYNPNEDKKYDRGSVPTIGDDGYDFVTGYTHFYRQVAERFEMPAGVEFNLTAMSMWVTNLRYCPTQQTSMDQTTKDIVFTVYGAKEDGSLDESVVFGDYKTTMAELYGTTGLGSPSGYMIAVQFPGGIETKGTFFVAIKYSDALLIDFDDINVGRSYVGHGAYLHGSGITTLFVKPYAVPTGSEVEADGNWYPIDKLDSTLKGIGANHVVWGAFKGEPLSVAINSTGEEAFASMFSGGDLIVSGVAEGDIVEVYNMPGHLVKKSVAVDSSTVIDMSDCPAGVYVVVSGKNAVKIIK